MKEKINPITIASFLGLILFIVLSVIVSYHKPFWRDEAFSALMAKQSVSTIITGSSQDFSPPLFYLILHFWGTIFGFSEISLRLLPLIFIILSIGLLLLLRKNIVALAVKDSAQNSHTDIPWIYTVIAIISPLFLYFSAELRQYSLLILLIIGSSALLSAWLQTDKKKWLILLIIINTLIAYTHNLGIFWLISQGAIATLYLAISKKWVQMRNVVISFALIVMLFFPWLRFLFSQAGHLKETFWLSFDPINSLTEISGLIVVNEGAKHTPILYGLFILLITILVLSGIRSFPPRKTFTVPLFTAGSTLILLYLFSAFVSPLFYNRYLAFLHPFVLCLVLFGLITLSNISRWLTGAVLTVYLILGLGIMGDFSQGITTTNFRFLTTLQRTPIYTEDVLLVMPCVYYNATCNYIGDLQMTPRYVGASQLTNIPTLSSWNNVQQSTFVLLYANSISSQLRDQLQHLGFTEKMHEDLGDGVEIAQFAR